MQDGQRSPNLTVGVSRSCVGGDMRTEHRMQGLFGGGLSIAAGDTDHGQPHQSPPGGCQRLQAARAVFDQNEARISGGLRVGLPHEQGSGRTGLEC